MSNTLNCAVCGITEKLKVCSKCKSTYYCCRNHQIDHWALHKLECAKQTSDNTESKTCGNNTVNFQTSPTDSNNAETEINQTKCKNGEAAVAKLCLVDPRQPQYRDLFSLSKFAKHYLDKDGFCLIDNILPIPKCSAVLQEVETLRAKNLFECGKLAGGKTSGIESEKVLNASIRSDEMFWINGTETDVCPNICDLVQQTMDAIVGGLNAFSNGSFNIEGRTKVHFRMFCELRFVVLQEHSAEVECICHKSQAFVNLVITLCRLWLRAIQAKELHTRNMLIILQKTVAW